MSPDALLPFDFVNEDGEPVSVMQARPIVHRECELCGRDDYIYLDEPIIECHSLVHSVEDL